MSDLDEKYLDPATNDFIKADPIDPAPDPHPERAGLDPEARAVLELVDLTVSLEDSRVPFATAAELSESADVDASDLAKDIDRLFPGRNEIDVGGRTLTRMVSGNFTVNWKPLSELPEADLKKISEAVRLRRY